MFTTSAYFKYKKRKRIMEDTKILISKETFIKVCDLIQKQNEKDHNFCSILENYIDGRGVPIMSEHCLSAIDTLMNEIFHDEPDELGSTWWEWFIYENDFGNKKMSVFLDNIEYVIKSASDLYDFIEIYLSK